MSEIIVSELKKEEAMEQNNRLLAEMSVILNTVHSGIVLTDAAYNILNINPSAYRILRLDPAVSLEGKQITTLLPDLLPDVLTSQHEKRKLHVTADRKLTSSELVTDIAPIYQDGVYLGSVISFDRLSEYVQLTNAMVSRQKNISFEAIIGVSKSIKEMYELYSGFCENSDGISISRQCSRTTEHHRICGQYIVRRGYGTY